MKPERVFADTNLFLRYLTNDVPAQADAVSSLLEQAERGELVLVTNALVMAEIVWTLDSYYQLPKAKIEEKLLAVLNTPGLEVIDSDIVMQAVVQFSRFDGITVVVPTVFPSPGLRPAKQDEESQE